MQQSISRRRMLTMAGGGLAGASAGLAIAAPTIAQESVVLRVASERNYRPLARPRDGRARISSTDPFAPGLSRVEGVLERRAVFEGRELAVFVRVEVPDNLRGRRRVLRTMMIGDNGDLRVETVGPEIRIDDPVFALEIVLGRGDPIRDWNLSRERIFALRVSLNVLETDEFAVSDDFLFKVLR